MEEKLEQEEQGKTQKTKRVWVKRVIAVSAGVFIALLSFLMGFLSRHWSLDKELQILVDVKNGIQKSYYKDVTDEEFYDTIFGAINDELLDKYSKYMDKNEVAESRAHGKGEYEGLGLAFDGSAGERESLKITRVAGNSPAEDVGIRAGQYVVGVSDGDKTEAEMLSVITYQQFKSKIDEYAVGESFCVYTCPTFAGTNRASYVVSKRAYTENYVYYRTGTSAYRFTGTDDATPSAYEYALNVLPTDTAYIRLTQFNGNANKAFDSAMRIFKEEGKKHLVLDLRGNGGGYMYIMQDIAKYFCKNTDEKKPVASYAQYEDSRTKYLATGNVYDDYFGEDSQIYVLADASSASASECLLGVLIDYGAVSYGNICLSKRDGVAKTYGKGIMQVTFSLSVTRGDALKLTTAYVLWPSTNCIHDRGILASDGTKTVEENLEGDMEIINALEAFGIV